MYSVRFRSAACRSVLLCFIQWAQGFARRWCPQSIRPLSPAHRCATLACKSSLNADRLRNRGRTNDRVVVKAVSFCVYNYLRNGTESAKIRTEYKGANVPRCLPVLISDLEKYALCASGVFALERIRNESDELCVFFFASKFYVDLNEIFLNAYFR